MSDGEDNVSTNALVEEMLQQGDTAVIYPEAPEEELQRQGTPEASIPDENGKEPDRESISCYLNYKNICVFGLASLGAFCSVEIL